MTEQTTPFCPAEQCGDQMGASLEIVAAAFPADLADVLEAGHRAELASDWLSSATPETFTGLLALACNACALTRIARNRPDLADEYLDRAERSCFGLVDALESFTGVPRERFVRDMIDAETDPRIPNEIGH